MFRIYLPLALLLAFLLTTAAEAKATMDGNWTVKSGAYNGTMVLHQSGSGVNGIWHTVSSHEVDTTVAGLVEGDTVTLVRSANGIEQKYVITLSKDGKHAEGYGDGPTFKHAFASFDRTDAKPNDAVLNVPQQASPVSTSTSQAQEFSGLMMIAGLAVLGVLISIGKEFFMTNQSGWSSLVIRYPCSDSMTSTDACWWLKTTRPGSNWNTSVEYGSGKAKLLPKFGIPPFQVGASSQGLILKRNPWNFAHQPIMIPWKQVVSAREVGLSDLLCRFGKAAPSSGSALGRVSALLGTVCEIKVADPNISIYIQMEAAGSIRQAMGAAFNSGASEK